MILVDSFSPEFILGLHKFGLHSFRGDESLSCLPNATKGPQIMKSSAMTHLFHLSSQIGPRPGGSTANEAAAQYIEQVLSRCGFAVERQTFACPTWVVYETYLELNGEWVPAAANPYSPPCNVTGSVVPIGTLAELEAADLQGQIALLYGHLVRRPLPCKAWTFKDEADARTVELLETKQPAAIIAVQSRLGDLERLIEDVDLPIPSVTVTAQVGLPLLKRPGAVAYLRIRSSLGQDETSNIIARRPGNQPGRVLVCAHYDTKYDTPGAADNGSGAAVLLAAAERLGAEALAYDLELVAFTNEEYLPVGSTVYMERLGDGVDAAMVELQAVINCDRVGCALGANSITTLAANDDFRASLGKLVQRYPGVAWVDPWIESDHAFFAFRGVPCIALSNSGAPHWDHLRGDTLDWISPLRLEEAVSLVCEAVHCLQNKPLGWGRDQ